MSFSPLITSDWNCSWRERTLHILHTHRRWSTCLLRVCCWNHSQFRRTSGPVWVFPRRSSDCPKRAFVHRDLRCGGSAFLAIHTTCSFVCFAHSLLRSLLRTVQPTSVYQDTGPRVCSTTSELKLKHTRCFTPPPTHPPRVSHYHPPPFFLAETHSLTHTRARARARTHTRTHVRMHEPTQAYKHKERYEKVFASV